LDDDSFPLDPGFFTAVLSVYHDHPDAAVLAMNIAHDGEPLSRRGPEIYSVADFVGCGCVYRRSAFLELAGYVPLHPAYGMEEADLALQVIDRGWEILHANDLRVRHATSRSHQSSRKIVAAHIKNTLLLAALRYPIAMAGYALLQYANRIVYSARRGHFLGVLTGVVQTPMHLWKYRAWRAPVRASTIIATQSLRRSSALAQDRTV
jgi:GT2 family glycosyltransferase